MGGEPGAEQTQTVEAVLAEKGRVLVLTAIAKDEGHAEDSGQLISYLVQCFKQGETRPQWGRKFRSAGPMTRPATFLLWAARAPDKVEPDVRPLSWLGEDVLICAGPVQDLLCLEGGTGQTRWRVERVWEYERRFMGPSVWRHFFGRSGEIAEEEKPKAKKKEDVAKRLPTRQFAIVGGPVVVEDPRIGGSEVGRSVFVAVSRGPAQYAEYLSDCVVYELAEGGDPRAMTTLPRMVMGGRHRVLPGGVVWACQGNAFVRLGTSGHRAGLGLGMGPGGPDLLCRVPWYRQLSTEEPDAWLTSGPAGEPMAFGETMAFRVVAGGYVHDPKERVYRFPIAMIDLQTGMDRTLLLSVPYKGTLAKPQSKYSQSSLPGGKERIQTLGPHVLAVTGLEVEGNRLRVIVGMEDSPHVVEFDSRELLGRKGK